MFDMLPVLEIVKRDNNSQNGSNHVSVNHNLPIQLLIIVGVVILSVTFLCSLAWICCASSNSKYRRARFGKFFSGKDANKLMKTESWNPQKPGSVYDFGEADSADGLSLKEKSDVSNDRHSKTSNRTMNGKVIPLSPLSPMPVLKNDAIRHHEVLDQGLIKTSEPLAVPPPAAMTPIQRGRGWQLFDGPVEEQNKDLEAGTLPPARRPSFIDRLLAHRSISQSNAVKMQTSNTISSPIPAQDALRNSHGKNPFLHERSVTTPALFSNVAQASQLNAPPPTPGIPGSGLISAIGGAFRRVSQTHQQYTTVKRKFIPSPRQLPIESDYEGTIGGKDADLPMARRTNERRSFCGDSNKSPIAFFDPYATPKMGAYNSPFVNAAAAMAAATGSMNKLPPHLSPSPMPFAPSPLGRSQLNMDNKKIITPFQTPGMAGIGTDWPRRMSATMIPQLPKNNSNTTNEDAQQQLYLDDLKRQRDWQHSQSASSSHPSKGEEKLQNWILENQFAAVPPPDEVSRRGSAISFVISERSLPSVSRQNSISYINSKKRQNLSSSDKSTKELQRMASLKPYFAPMTSLESWLEQDPVEGKMKEQQQSSAARITNAHKKRSRKSTLSQVPSLTATEAEKHSIIEKYFDENVNADNNFDNQSQITDYEQKRGQIWEDEISQPPSYRTDPSRNSVKRGISLGTETSKREIVTITGEGGTMTEFTLVHKSIEEEAAEKRRLKNEKRIRKQMRAARRAAKKAAKEAAELGINPQIMKLPAVQAVIHELTDAMASSDSSKARDQTLRHQMIDQRSDIASDQGTKVGCESVEKIRENNHNPVDWVAELVQQSPKFTQPFQANILMEKLRAEQSKVQELPQYKATSPKRGVQPKRIQKRNSRNIKKRNSRMPIVRSLSPPESPLTSASEYPDHSIKPFDQQRRCSMPINRSFLVESRRGSEESEIKLHHQNRQDHQVGQFNKRITSMPLMVNDLHMQQQQQQFPPERQSTRRRLPSPPGLKQGGQLPISAYDQIPQTAVWIP